MGFSWSKYDKKNKKNSESAVADVIQWDEYSGKENEIVWKHPQNEIRWGTVLIVQEYEAAVFFRDGKIYDVFGPGRHALTTPNLPLLTRAFNMIYSQPLFNSTVYFVAKRESDGFFGGKTQTKEMFPLLANGQYWFKIIDPTLFVNEVVGGRKKYTPEEVSKFLKGFITESLMKELAAFSLSTVFAEALDTVSLKIRNAVQDKFMRFGLDLFDLRFNTIDTEERYRELAVMVQQGIPAIEVLRNYTLRESAESLGKSTGGAGLGAGFMLPTAMQGWMSQPQPAQNQVPPTIHTPEEKPSKGKDHDEAIAILRKRYAEGKIDEREFLARKAMLES